MSCCGMGSKWQRAGMVCGIFDAVCDFVMRDPDIAALWRQRPVQKQIIMESIAIVLDYAATDLDGCREKFGHEFVDLIVASRDRLLTKSHGGADGPAA